MKSKDQSGSEDISADERKLTPLVLALHIKKFYRWEFEFNFHFVNVKKEHLVGKKIIKMKKRSNWVFHYI